MDKNLYEFWSQFFTSLARGQKQMDDWTQWQRPGSVGPDSFASLFQNIYGLGALGKGAPPDLTVWEKSAEAFQKSLKDFFALFDVVPREDYQKLLNECRVLKEKTAEQEATIAVLRKRRGKKEVFPEETVEGLQEVIRKQNDEFQSLMKTMANLLQTPSKS